MNARLPWLADSRIPQVVRVAVRRTTRYSQHFFSTLGVTAFVAAIALWIQPQWRTAAASRLMPLLAAAEQTGPAVGRLLSSGAIQVLVPSASARAASLPMVPYAQPPVGTDPSAQGDAPALVANDLSLETAPARMPSIQPFASMIPDDRVVADARDDRVIMSPVEQDRVATYLSRRYHVAEAPMSHLVDAAFDTGREVGLDPLLLLSVMAIESAFNPYAESGVGAQGLMQVMSKVHSDKFNYFGGPAAALQPLANIKVGALVLKDCIARGGSLATGLRLYVGSTTPSNDGGYGAKVIAERLRLRDVAHGRPVPINAPQAPVQTAQAAPVKVAAPAAAHGAKSAASDADVQQDDADAQTPPHAGVKPAVHLAEAG
ncbi:lytic transglycosylase domain-containing protein [Pararobbsia silviterrae]|uniref:Lytic transglycosylase domain-containing protein n=1 Tax=Pararobbsia silviterrae TaxID=1792498 RepID=A0A494Y936_9BURK|nr:lytic transglycosylase domain-containing protein [Pararobbsia silviterrae]RKP59151.1 lytic transglycosylase domain-containing protein [Pararobbsia silviterrae]